MKLIEPPNAPFVELVSPPNDTPTNGVNVTSARAAAGMASSATTAEASVSRFIVIMFVWLLNHQVQPGEVQAVCRRRLCRVVGRKAPEDLRIGGGVPKCGPQVVRQTVSGWPTMRPSRTERAAKLLTA